MTDVINVVVNIRDLGRIGTWPADVRRIDRRSPYGNPFRITNGDCTHPDCGPGSHPPADRAAVIAADYGLPPAAWGGDPDHAHLYGADTVRDRRGHAKGKASTDDARQASNGAFCGTAEPAADGLWAVAE